MVTKSTIMGIANDLDQLNQHQEKYNPVQKQNRIVNIIRWWCALIFDP
jgi:hypothetical protein